MTDDPAAPDARIVILTAPHPATRRAVAFLALALAAAERPVGCELVTATDSVPPPGTALYLRAGVTDAADLLVTTSLYGGGALRQACALLAGLDGHWHGVPRLSLETVLDTPYVAVRQVARQAGVAIGEPVFTAVDAHIASLRDAVAGYRHALPFLAAMEADTSELAWLDEGLLAADGIDGVVRLVAPGVPRRLLIVGPAVDAEPAPSATADGWHLVRATLAEAMMRLPGPTDERLGVIRFDHLQGADALGDLLDRAMARLAPGGLLCGREHLDTAAEAAVAQLTKAGDQHQLVFVLSANSWLAISPAWWR